MRTRHRQSGMTLIEILVVLAVVVILISFTSVLGLQLKEQAAVKLTEGTLGVLDTAIEQYFDDTGEFIPQIISQAEFESLLGITVRYLPDTPSLSGESWTSFVLYYFLSRNPHSAQIIDALMDQVITGKNPNGIALRIEIPTGSTPIDLIRFVDAWGIAIRYQYNPAMDVFPIVISAGPDGIFDTPDDIRNEQ